MTRKFIILALLLYPLSLAAQHTTTTATVADVNGGLYVNCTGSASFNGENTTPGAGPYLLGGSVFQTVVPFNCDGNANLSISLADNNQISPTPSQWRFSVCSAQGYVAGPYCFSTLVTVTGTTQSATAALRSAAPLLPQGATPTPGGLTGQTQVRGGNNALVGQAPIFANLVTGTGNNDMGDKVNTAGASSACTVAGQTSGCMIYILPDPSGGCWSYTTPILLNGTGVAYTLAGSPGGASCITYTPSSGNAVTIDPGTSNVTATGNLTGAGVRDLAIFGACTQSSNVPVCSGITSQGLVIGPVNGAYSLTILNVKLGRLGAGFAAGVEFGANTFGDMFFNVSALGNSVGALLDNLNEKNTWVGGFISQNITGISITHAGSDPTFQHIKFDDNTTCAISLTAISNLTLEDTRYENGGGGTDCWLNATAGSVYWTDGQWNDDLVSGTSAQNVTFSGNALQVNNVKEFVSPGHTVTNAWNLTNSASNVTLHVDDSVLGSRILNEYNTAYAGRLDYKAITPSINPGPYTLQAIELFATQFASLTASAIPAPGTGALILAPNNSLLAAFENAAGNGVCGLGIDGSNNLGWSGTGCNVVFPPTTVTSLTTGASGTAITLHQEARVTTGSISGTTRAEVLLTWPNSMGTSTYTANCNVEDSTTAAASQGLTFERIRTKSATQVGAVVNNPTGGSLTGTIDCFAETP